MPQSFCFCDKFCFVSVTDFFSSVAEFFFWQNLFFCSKTLCFYGRNFFFFDGNLFLSQNLFFVTKLFFCQSNWRVNIYRCVSFIIWQFFGKPQNYGRPCIEPVCSVQCFCTVVTPSRALCHLDTVRTQETPTKYHREPLTFVTFFYPDIEAYLDDITLKGVPASHNICTHNIYPPHDVRENWGILLESDWVIPQDEGLSALC